MQRVAMIAALAAALAAPILAPAQEISGAVCADPARPCPGFKAHDLSFPLPTDGRARAEVRSTPFFAVILKTTPRCRAGEAERREIQALFPRHKVFVTRFECDDSPENNVRYSNVDAKLGFVAVYAGEERAAAEEVLARAASLGRFPGANLRHMQVIFVSP